MEKKNFTPWIILGLIMIGLLGVGLWRYRTFVVVKPAIKTALYDSSKSKPERCGCIAQYARQIAEAAKTPNQMFQLYSLGTRENGFKPQLIVSLKVPFNDSLLRANSVAENNINDFVKTVESKCAAIPHVNDTPVYHAVETIVREITPKCDLESGCELYAQTDLVEDVEPNVIAAFKSEKTGGKTKTQMPKIENDRVKISLSGVSELIVSQAKKAGKNVDTKDKALTQMQDNQIWQSVWKSAFTNPSAVEFKQFCDRPIDKTTAQN